MKPLSLIAGAALALSALNSASALSLDGVQVWTGAGTNRAAMVIEWSSPEVLTNTAVPPPIAAKTLAWGYRWNGDATAADMFKAVLASDPRIFAAVPDASASFVLGLAFDLNNNRLLGVQDGTNILSYSPLTNTSSFSNGLSVIGWSDADQFTSLDVADLYWGGASGPGWEMWIGAGGNAGFMHAPDRGAELYWTPDDPALPWTGGHGQWRLADAGLASTTLHDGSWIGWTVAAGGLDYANPEAACTIAYNYHKHAPSMPMAAPLVLSPYGAEVAAVQGSFVGAALYTDTNAVLGEPATYTQNSDPIAGNTPYHVKMVEPAYNIDVDGKPCLLSLNRSGSSITIAFDHPVSHNPANPYGVDFQVFGNTFYVGGGTAGGYINDTTDMRIYRLAGGAFSEPILVSVSPDGFNWYTYASGPYCDSVFPTHGYQWDANQYDQAGNGWTRRRMDFTKPVNPSLTNTLGVPGTSLSAADAIALYAGSGGGAGFSLAKSGFESIRYVRISAETGFTGGELDAISIVRPMVLGEGLVVTPQNVQQDGCTAFHFMDPEQTGRTILRMDFTGIDDMALVTPTRGLNSTNLATLPGRCLEAITLIISSPTGLTNVPCAATATIALPPQYQGDGSDLDALKWNGTNWHPMPFLHQGTGNTIAVHGITGTMDLAVVQISPPSLQLVPGGSSLAFRFAPVTGWTHALQRTTDFTHWEDVASVVPEESATAILRDDNPPPGHAFYRLRLARP